VNHRRKFFDHDPRRFFPYKHLITGGPCAFPDVINNCVYHEFAGGDSDGLQSALLNENVADTARVVDVELEVPFRREVARAYRCRIGPLVDSGWWNGIVDETLRSRLWAFAFDYEARHSAGGMGQVKNWSSSTLSESQARRNWHELGCCSSHPLLAELSCHDTRKTKTAGSRDLLNGNLAPSRFLATLCLAIYEIVRPQSARIKLWLFRR